MDYSERRKKIRNPRESANILSFLTFAYTGTLFKKALKTDLVDDDIYEVLESCESKRNGDLLEKLWNAELQKASPSMAKLMWQRWGKKYLLIGCIDLIWRTIKSILEPTAVSNLISYFKPEQTNLSKSDAYYYASVVLLVNFINCVFMHNYIMWVQELAIEIKAAFSSLIYRKALKLSSAALSEITLGNIVTLITKDVLTFRLSIWIINDIWIGFVQVAVICYLLYSKIGIVSLAGIAVLALAIPIQVYLGKVVTKLKMKTGKKTDERLQTTQEALNSIRIIKMYTWEKFFYNKINKTRCKELATLLLVFYIKMVIVLIGIIFSKAGFYVLLTAYIYSGYASNTTLIFYFMAHFKDLKATLGSSIPNRMGKAGEFISSFKRISKLLNTKELLIKPQELRKPSNLLISVNNATIKIGDKKILDQISLEINPGLTIVTGRVGSGKSTLLKLFVGEYALKGGDFVCHGEISYAPQDPWLFPSTIKQNILFGEVYDEARYKEAIRVCALQYDLNLFENGDETVLCDRGGNLSKGQQARINLARAVYKKCDIYLLDDSLTALDQSVQNYIFNECIKKFLKNKIVLLVTQTASHIEQADKVLIMDCGRIQSFSKPDKKVLKDIEMVAYKDDDLEKDCARIGDKKEDDETHGLLESDVKSCKPVYGEVQKKGSVNIDVYKKYFIYGGGFALAFFNVALGGVTQASESYSDKLLTKWVDNKETVLNIKYNLSDKVSNTTLDLATSAENETFKLYTVMIIAAAVLDLIKTYCMFDFCRRASVNLHKAIIQKIINAVMLFFDNNYIGNILNRFSQDLSNIDEQLPYNLGECYRVVFSAAGIVVLIASINISFLVYNAIIFVALLFLRYIYLPAGRSLKRLDASTRSPMIGHLNASLEGATTIRAFRKEALLIKEFDLHQNLHTSAHYMSACTIRAFGFFMDFLCLTFMVVVIIRFIVFDSDTSAGSFGLALTQVMLLGNTVQWGVREWSELENLMTSMERALEYTNINTETKQGLSLENWPKNGSVQYDNVSLSYNGKETVLKNLNFEVAAGEKIGIVGRTGAGKSSIIASLFRFYQIEGKILIDGVNISTLSLDFLRKKLAIIPQDPVIFSGTIRSNLDPYNEYPDDKLWEALDKANLKKQIRNLDQVVSPSDPEISSGQKQLICLARAILKNSKIVFLDEASANMDPETDRLFHQTVTKNFANCTMFIIAHRLHSVINCDKILVMNKGEMVEFGAPSHLLSNKKGLFYDMVLHSGLNLQEV